MSYVIFFPDVVLFCFVLLYIHVVRLVKTFYQVPQPGGVIGGPRMTKY